MAFDNMDPRNARRIGFLPASQATSAAGQRSPCPAAMLQFDGGESVAFEDARHNTLVLGTTGSGSSYAGSEEGRGGKVGGYGWGRYK